jgi:opacity protein-like surface antigen
MLRHLCRTGLALALAAAFAPAHAGEGTFGWITTLDLQPKGTLEFEQRVQLNKGQAGGTYEFWQARSEVEYGYSENLQLSAYVNASYTNAYRNYPATDEFPNGETGGWGVAYPGDGHYRKTRLEGASFEAIWRLSNPVVDPVGVGLYGELTLGSTKDEFESRLLLQSNFLDDRLVLAANVIASVEKVKFVVGETGRESSLDVLFGATYRIANNWSAGMEARYHNDYDGYNFQTHTQEALFVGPNVHYANKDWWVTTAWRYQPTGGKCWAPNTGECSDGRVWDSHSRNEFIVKFGMPF